MEANGTYTFTMLFEPAEEGGYVVTCPALPGLVTEGDTMEEARRMAEDALRGYLESFLTWFVNSHLTTCLITESD